MDEKYLEMADALSQGEIAAGIERARKRVSRPVDFDGSCECGEEIPQGRQDLGFYNCIACQEALEARRKKFR